MLTVHVKLLFFPSPSPSIIIHFITWLHATLKPKIFTWCGKIHAEVSRFLVLHDDCQTKIWIQHTVYSISQQWHLPGHDGAPRSSTAIFTFFLRSDSCFILEGTRRKRAQKLCIVRLFFSNYGFKGLFCTVLNPMFWIQSKIYKKHCLLENRQCPKIQSSYNEMICHGIQQCSLFSSSFLNLKR